MKDALIYQVLATKTSTYLTSYANHPFTPCMKSEQPASCTLDYLNHCYE